MILCCYFLIIRYQCVRITVETIELVLFRLTGQWLSRQMEFVVLYTVLYFFFCFCCFPDYVDSNQSSLHKLRKNLDHFLVLFFYFQFHYRIFKCQPKNKTCKIKNFWFAFYILSFVDYVIIANTMAINMTLDTYNMTFINMYEQLVLDVLITLIWMKKWKHKV